MARRQSEHQPMYAGGTRCAIRALWICDLVDNNPRHDLDRGDSVFLPQFEADTLFQLPNGRQRRDNCCGIAGIFLTGKMATTTE
jgi:hypothetical protein